MAFNSEFTPIALEELHREAAVKKAEGWRFVQTHAVNTDDGVDLYYSFMRNGTIDNLCVKGVKKGQAVPSITDLFLAAFVFENEARELFGVDMRDIAIDFDGAMYAPAESEPMTFISPEQKAAREKAKKIAAAKAAKAAKADAESGASDKAALAKGGFVMTPERRARLDAKLATMSPEKVAKVEAALKAREAESAGAAVAAPAAKVTQEAPEAEKAAAPKTAAEEPQALHEADEQLEQLINLMDESKARIVRQALQMKEGE